MRLPSYSALQRSSDLIGLCRGCSGWVCRPTHHWSGSPDKKSSDSWHSCTDWTLADSNGKKFTLKDFRGQLVVLDFWGTWCLPCRKGMPAIQALHDKFKARGVAVFGIAVADQEGDPVGYMKRMSFTYGLLLKGDSVAADYKASMMPTLYVIGVDGKILHAESGYREKAKEELNELIERSLNANKK
ncbi:MAG: TlpA disulfide reductase family protein [Gemmatales bacterium]